MTVSGSEVAKQHSDAPFKSIELFSETPFIDFHYNNSGSDFTSRIIEIFPGVLRGEGFFKSGQVMDADDAPYGLSFISPESPNHPPLAFWSTLLTVGQDNYKQQIAFPWAAGELAMCYRVYDNSAWYDWKYIKFIEA